MSSPEGLTLRVMEPRDIPAGMRLKTLAGWNQTENDWQIFLKESPEGCFVAERDGKVVGSVATIRYGKGTEQVAWISMVLVDPNVRRGGIGKTLLNKALEHLSDCPSVKLDATPEGRELYLKLGFVDQFLLNRYYSPKIENLAVDIETILIPMQQTMIPEIASMDQNVTGLSRTSLLGSMLTNAPQLGWRTNPALKTVMPHEGYVLGRPGTNAWHIGPLVAQSTSVANMLASQALAKCLGQPVFFDVFETHTKFTSWLRALGFKSQRSLIRMYKGSPGPKGKSESNIAIVGPEFG